MWFVPTQTTYTQNPRATSWKLIRLRETRWATLRFFSVSTSVWGWLSTLLEFTVHSQMFLGHASGSQTHPDTPDILSITGSHIHGSRSCVHFKNSFSSPMPRGPQEDWAGNEDSSCGQCSPRDSHQKRGFLSLTCPHETPQHSRSGHRKLH